MALASSGLTQSVAVSQAGILATVAYAGFLPILICFIPMLGIAIGYQRLNAWHTSGATRRSVTATRSRPSSPEPGAAEQQPGDWLNAFTSVTLGLARAVAVERWQAVGLSAMLPTLVLTDGVGAAATPGGIDAPSSRRHPRTARPGHHLGGRSGAGRGQRVPRGLGGDALYRVPAHRTAGTRPVPAADGAATGGPGAGAGRRRGVHPPDPSLTDSSAIVQAERHESAVAGMIVSR
jgi:hypothetical protein